MHAFQKSDQIYISLLLLLLKVVACFARNIEDLIMPGVQPLVDDTYYCTAKKLNPRQAEYIISYRPNANATKVHHIIIYGCSKPGKRVRDTPNYVWKCDEMTNKTPIGSDPLESQYETGPVCAPSAVQSILYAWALDAPALELPEGVGFKIGGQTSIQYLVLQVHYGNTKPFREAYEVGRPILDQSGIMLNTVTSGIDKLAGIYLMLSYGYVERGLTRHKLQCRINEAPTKVIHPFRFRTHTHKLGLKVAAYLSRPEEPENLLLIGKHNPQEAQMFYQVENSSMIIRGGDSLVGYCKYNNHLDHIVRIAGTGNDEMCNFYLMYWTHGHELLREPDCLTYNPQ